MATLKVLEVPIKTGNTITNGRLELGTVIKHLTIPVLDGGVVTDVSYDLPSGAGADYIVGVVANPSNLYGKPCVCTDSNGDTVDTQTISNTGHAAFVIPSTGTYTFTITF